MQINYFIVAIVITLLTALIIWIIKTDRKNEKHFEQQIIDQKLKPREHQKPQKAGKAM
jgi:Na+/melibiose symporter-like transporter